MVRRIVTTMICSAAWGVWVSRMDFTLVVGMLALFAGCLAIGTAWHFIFNAIEDREARSNN